jgi:hypothetical protein
MARVDVKVRPYRPRAIRSLRTALVARDLMDIDAPPPQVEALGIEDGYATYRTRHSYRPSGRVLHRRYPPREGDQIRVIRDVDSDDDGLECSDHPWILGDILTVHRYDPGDPDYFGNIHAQTYASDERFHRSGDYFLLDHEWEFM